MLQSVAPFCLKTMKETVELVSGKRNNENQRSNNGWWFRNPKANHLLDVKKPVVNDGISTTILNWCRIRQQDPTSLGSKNPRQDAVFQTNSHMKTEKTCYRKKALLEAPKNSSIKPALTKWPSIVTNFLVLVGIWVFLKIGIPQNG